MASFIRTVRAPADAEVLGRHGLSGTALADDDPAQPLAHVGQARGQGQDGHDLAGHGDVEARFADHALLFGAQPDLDAAEEAVVDVDDPVPGDARRVDVEPEDAALLLGVEVVGIGLFDAELLEPAKHRRREPPPAFLVGGAEGVEELSVVLGRFVEDAGVDGRSQEIVGGGHGVDVPGQMQVEVLHGNDLGIAPARGPALDPERRAHAGLPDDGDDLFAQVGAEGLAHPHRGRRLALAERSGGDGGHVHVVAERLVLDPSEDIKVDLRLVLAVEVEVVLAEPQHPRDCDDGKELRGLGDLDIARDGLDGFHGHAGRLLHDGGIILTAGPEENKSPCAPRLLGRDEDMNVGLVIIASDAGVDFKRSSRPRKGGGG